MKLSASVPIATPASLIAGVVFLLNTIFPIVSKALEGYPLRGPFSFTSHMSACKGEMNSAKKTTGPHPIVFFAPPLQTDLCPAELCSVSIQTGHKCPIRPKTLRKGSGATHKTIKNHLLWEKDCMYTSSTKSSTETGCLTGRQMN